MNGITLAVVVTMVLGCVCIERLPGSGDNSVRLCILNAVTLTVVMGRFCRLKRGAFKPAQEDNTEEETTERLRQVPSRISTRAERAMQKGETRSNLGETPVPACLSARVLLSPLPLWLCLDCVIGLT